MPFKVRLWRWVRAHGFKWFQIAWIIVFSIAVVSMYRSNRHLANQGKEAHQAICALKGSLRDRVESSESFLAQHPNGIPGIPASVIRQSVTSQRATLKSLSRLDCK